MPKAQARTIIWLASYPKSGSTWLRSLLTAAMFPDEPLDINALVGGPMQIDRQLLDDQCGIDSAHLSCDELIPYRASLHHALAQEATGPLFLKTHDCFARSASGQCLFPAEASGGAIYIVRDPIDIVPSLAHHEGRDLAWTCARISDPTATLNSWPDTAATLLPEWMNSWSGHVASWMGQSELPVCLVRYEDLHRKPHETLASVLGFAGLACSTEHVYRAVEACAIDRLQEQERNNRFREAAVSTRHFFRHGIVGDGRATIDARTVEQLCHDHGEWMARMGYPAIASALQN